MIEAKADSIPHHGKEQQGIHDGKGVDADFRIVIRAETAAGDIEPSNESDTLHAGKTKEAKHGRQVGRIEKNPRQQAYGNGQLNQRERNGDHLPEAGTDKLISINRSEKKIRIPPVRNPGKQEC